LRLSGISKIQPGTPIAVDSEIMKVSTTRPYSILITDDDRACREALREIVEPQGYRIILASSGEEAVEIVRVEPVHAALLDMHMPTLTGLDTMRLMRQINEILPCILVTADATDALIRQALNAHAYSVIPKPVNKHLVLHTVVRALDRYQASTAGDSSGAARRPA
jgi:CheY-like chemotaxis protein